MRAVRTLIRQRNRAESLMTDRCRITLPPSTDRDLDKTTLRYVSEPGEVIYEGPCQLKQQQPSASSATAGEAALEVQDTVLKLPVATSGDVVAGCVVVYLEAPDDPSLVDQVFGVTAVATATHATTRRCRVRAGVRL